MASTRDRNQPGDYMLEQRINSETTKYSTYEHYGVPTTTQFAGDGLLMGRMAASNLAFNSCDIESQLFGIGSTNLVNPKSNVTPDIKPLQNLSIIDRLPILVPEPLVVQKNQRPYLNNTW